MTDMNSPAPDTLEMPVAAATAPRRLSAGLPCGLASGERRFPLTPEGAAMLVERGIDVVMERGAGAPIHYSDEAYARAGVTLASRAETLLCDAVISLAPLAAAEIATMRRGALLMTLAPPVVNGSVRSARALLDRGILTLAMERVEDEGGNRRVADILHEIDGCASLAIASALLTDPVHGKGILLGGVTGIVPCEVTVLGSGMGAVAAAHCALGMGAVVRMFDDDLYSLRQASRVLDHKVIASAMHPHVLEGALKSADVVIATPMADSGFAVTSEQVGMMKARVLVFDLNPCPGTVFPSLPLCDLGETTEREKAAGNGRMCCINVGCQVPRTAAMALSNVLLPLTQRLLGAVAGNSPENALMLQPGIRCAAMTVFSKAVDPTLAGKLGVRCLDPNLFTSLS